MPHIFQILAVLKAKIIRTYTKAEMAVSTGPRGIRRMASTTFIMFVLMISVLRLVYTYNSISLG